MNLVGVTGNNRPWGGYSIAVWFVCEVDLNLDHGGVSSVRFTPRTGGDGAYTCHSHSVTLFLINRIGEKVAAISTGNR